MINTLTIIGETTQEIKVFAYYADKALNKLYLPDFDASVIFTEDEWDDIEFTLKLSEGVQYSAKEFLRSQFKLWAKRELHGKLYNFCIYSKDRQDITNIKFKVKL